jgi:glycosyltransferase involved in cell wall biosynthesis
MRTGFTDYDLSAKVQSIQDRREVCKEMKLSEKITIVVPCKNEENYIAHLLMHLRQQDIGSTKIIIADCSTDNTREVIQIMKGDLNVEVIEGGPVSLAKNNGAKLVNTPYILFIDSDVRFFKDTVIRDAVSEIEAHDLDLIGLNARCYDKNIVAQIGFSIFNVINNVLKYFSPFAVGAFMLTRRDRFEEFGGFPEKFATSEDFFLSRQYSPKKFRILNHHFGQDSRRFKKMGYFGMAAYLIKNFINRNNKEYWDKLDSSRYWN